MYSPFVVFLLWNSGYLILYVTSHERLTSSAKTLHRQFGGPWLAPRSACFHLTQGILKAGPPLSLWHPVPRTALGRQWAINVLSRNWTSLVGMYLKKKKSSKNLSLVVSSSWWESSVLASPAVIDSFLFISDLPTHTKDLGVLTARVCMHWKDCTLQDGFWVNCAPSRMSASGVNPDLLSFSKSVLMEAGVTTWGLSWEKWSGRWGTSKLTRKGGASRSLPARGQRHPADVAPLSEPKSLHCRSIFQEDTPSVVSHVHY